MIINVSRSRAALYLLATVGIVNLLTFFNPFPLFFSSVLLIVLLIIPGILILTSINRSIPHLSIENFLSVIGLSLSFLILGGLLINTLGPLLGIERPLSRTPLLITFDILLLIFAAVVLFLHKTITFELNSYLKFKKIDFLFIAYGLLCLLLVLGGSQILNNGGTGGWILGAIAGLASYIVLGVLLQKKLSPITLPIAIFLFGFSLLLSYSLRSNYVFGWDINQEFHVFQLTNSAKRWAIGTDRNPYNACLSITILPTVLSTITRISGEVLFKIVFQGIFAFVPLAIYKLTRLILPNKDRRLGFLAAVIFASQTWFIMQAPILARQEVALFFFSTFLIIIFNQKLAYRKLRILFGLMIILSHYSTAYVMLVLFALYFFIRWLFIKKPSKLLSARLLTILFIITFLWQYQMTHTAGNLNQTIDQTISSLPQVFSSTGLGSSVSQITFSTPDLNTQKNNNSTFESATRTYSHLHTNLYSLSTYAQYEPQPLPPPIVNSPIKGISAGLITSIGRIDKLVLSDVLPLVGLAVLGYMTFNNKKATKRRDYIVLSLASMILIGVMLVLPLLKVNYNLTRLWLQALIIFASLIAFGGYKVLSKFHRSRYLILALSAAVFLLYSAGLMSYVAGDTAQAMFSNNSNDYNLYYTTTGEVLSAQWLSASHLNLPVYADQLASLRLSAYGGIQNTVDHVYPSTITKDSYVYESQSNINGMELVKYKNGLLEFTFPKQFLQQEKNNVYDNQTSMIYH
jgi:uncharacterized membrane protein